MLYASAGWDGRSCQVAFVVTVLILVRARLPQAYSSSRPASFISAAFKNRGGLFTTNIRVQRSLLFPRTSVAVCDTRRKRKLHYDVPKPDSNDGNFDNWEFGVNAGWSGENNGRSLRIKQHGDGSTQSVGKEAEEREDENHNMDHEEEDDRHIRDVAAATECLSRFCTAARLERLRDIVNKRTKSVQFVFENVANPNNLWACLRSLDAFGVQYAHVILDTAHYRKPHRLAQAKSAMGSQKWLTVREHPSASACVAALKREGYYVLASDLKPGTSPKPVQEVNWAAQKVAIVMGNEERGITEEMRSLCDGTFQIPMMGFAESFNLSGSTAVTLAFVSSMGGLKHGDLPTAEKNLLLLRWLLRSVPQGPAILRREGLLIEDEGFLPTSKAVLGYNLGG